MCVIRAHIILVGVVVLWSKKEKKSEVFLS